MTFDYYAFLETSSTHGKCMSKGSFASIGDACPVWSCHKKEKGAARQRDWHEALPAPRCSLLAELHPEPCFIDLPDPHWLGIEVDFTLQTPWYSKDDRPFHVLDNPVRKDRVFGVPFMAASSWKGLLRWACRMQQGLLEYLKAHDMRMDGWKDEPWIVHLFGNEKGEADSFQSGALAFYPTWFNNIGFEAINPHCRATKAGKHPIYYEVVPAKTEGCLRLLYASNSVRVHTEGTNPAEALLHLADAIDKLLSTYGISAKRTAGWGTAEITAWTGMLHAQKLSTTKTSQCLQYTDTREQCAQNSFTSGNIQEFKEMVKRQIT